MQAHFVVGTFLDDLPAVWISPLRASGVIAADTAVTAVRLDDSELEFAVGVTHRRFPNGGDWAFFVCPACARFGRKLWLLDGVPRCKRCCIERGVGMRAWPMSPRRRAEVSVPKLLARLERAKSSRLYPRPGRGLERRASLENSLRLAQLVLKQHRLKGVKAALAAVKKDE
jgi:hypothetical protein